ncbi:MAG: tyrosine-type recombinase/integrase [Gemmatimonadetes bacterium]|nr:tyrosine-type recombinase/integrase [Gemmatimonadota bacterium]
MGKTRATKNHPGHIEKRGEDSWRVTLCVDGQYSKYTVRGDREAAETRARTEYDTLKSRSTIGLPGPMSFSALLARFEDAKLPGLAPNTQAGYTNSLAAFRTYFVSEGRDPQLHAIRPGHVEGFLAWRRMRQPDGTRRKEALSARSLRKDRATLHLLFAFALTLEVVDSNPVSRTKAPKGDQREPIIITADQYEALLTACEGQPMLYLYVLMLAETGMRCESEALWVRWEDMDLETGLLNVESVRKGRRTKSGKSRRVPITPRLRTAIRAHMALYRFARYGSHADPTPWVFHHDVKRRHAKAGDRIRSLRRSFAGAVKRAELPADLNQHDLRHRRVTVWLAEGKPAHIVQKAMGHSDLRTTLDYAHLVDDDLLQLVAGPTENVQSTG